VNQVLYAESGSEISEEECKALCETYDASAYNWMDDTHPNGNIGCRCYASDALTFYPTGESWNFCTKDYDYICVEGFSPNWSTENQNARGSGVNQVLYAESGSEISEEECKALCETYDASAYNWMDDTHPNGNKACRCYASDALTFTPTGTDWQFCRQRSVCLLKEGSDCVTLLASATCYNELASLGIDMQGTIASSGICPCSCAEVPQDLNGDGDPQDLNGDGIVDIPCSSTAQCEQIMAMSAELEAIFGDIGIRCYNGNCVPGGDAKVKGEACWANEQCWQNGITCVPGGFSGLMECDSPGGWGAFCLQDQDCESDVCDSAKCAESLGLTNGSICFFTICLSETRVGKAVFSMVDAYPKTSGVTSLFALFGIVNLMYMAYSKCFKANDYAEIEDPEV